MFATRLEAAPTTLVIDCQEGFLTPLGFRASERIVRTYSENVADIVRDASSRWDRIVFVEYDGYGDTLPMFHQAASGGHPTVTLHKNANGIFENPHDHVRNLRAFMGLRSSRARVDIIGLNASACVLSSFVELLTSGVNCRVRAEGTINHIEKRYGVYRTDNNVAQIRRDYDSWGWAYGHMFDRSRLGGATNLVDFHLRGTRTATLASAA